MMDRPMLLISGIAPTDSKWTELLADEAAIQRMADRLVDSVGCHNDGIIPYLSPWEARSIVEDLIAAAAAASLKPANY